MTSETTFLTIPNLNNMEESLLRFEPKKKTRPFVGFVSSQLPRHRIKAVWSSHSAHASVFSFIKFQLTCEACWWNANKQRSSSFHKIQSSSSVSAPLFFSLARVDRCIFFLASNLRLCKGTDETTVEPRNYRPAFNGSPSIKVNILRSQMIVL